MSTKKTTEIDVAAEAKVPAEAKGATEVKYNADEFAAAAASVFGEGITPDLVRAAFSVAGVKELTKAEAKKLVNNFAKKEVTR